MQCSLTLALIKLEISLVCLAIRPHIGAFTRLFTLVEISVVKTTITPLEKTISMHAVVLELSLIYVAFGCYAPSEPMDLPTIKVTLKYRIVGIHLKAYAIWFARFHITLTSVLSPTLSVIPIHP